MKYEKIIGWAMFAFISAVALGAQIKMATSHYYMNGVKYVHVGMTDIPTSNGDKLVIPVFRQIGD